MNPGNDALTASGMGADDRTYRRIEGHRHPYVCAVTRKPARPREQERRVALGAALALAGEVYLFPTEPTGKLNFRSFGERADAAHRGEPTTAPAVYVDGPVRAEKRAARKIANARKARRGWR